MDRAGAAASLEVPSVAEDGREAERSGRTLDRRSVRADSVSEDCTIEDVGALLEDPTARSILVHTSQEPMSATTLSDRCGVSRPTVYRRLEDLRACDLIVERTQPDLESGHHREVYSTNLERIVVELDDGDLGFRIDRAEDVSDRFTRLIEEI